MVYWVHGLINVISAGFESSHFELTNSHRDFSVLSLDSSSTKTWGLTRKCNFTNFDGGHFENGVPEGSPSQFGDGGILFSCSDKSQEQNKISLVRSWGGGGGGGGGAQRVYRGPWTTCTSWTTFTSSTHPPPPPPKETISQNR